MKAAIFSAALAVAFGPSLLAIPDVIIGPIVQANGPLNGQDLTGPVLAALEHGKPLPGDWQEEGRVGDAAISHLLARPMMFGREVVLLRAVRRDGSLERVEATFADAGSFFGYHGKLTKATTVEAAREALKARQEEFEKIYAESLAEVRKGISSLADKERPKERRVGKGRTLRAEVEEWEKGELLIRLFKADQRLVRVEMARKDLASSGWMDRAFADESEQDRAARFMRAVVKSDDGVVRLSGIEPIPQGYRPYCGLNTLAMAARHFGLHLDEDWLAAAGEFENTGSAAGSNMVRLYSAVAAEAGLSMNRKPGFDEIDVRRALESGRPVIVWRRFSWERNQFHDQVAGGGEALPDPRSPAEQAMWPEKGAPLHASILTGFDPLKREVFFLESWAGADEPRRMRFEEMAATTYLCFVFEH